MDRLMPSDFRLAASARGLDDTDVITCVSVQQKVES